MWPWLLAVSFTSLSLLNLQVTATRLLSYKFYYHFVFFVISMAQLGLAAAGTWACLRERASAGPRILARALAGMGWSVLALLAVYSWLSPEIGLGWGKLDPRSAFPYLLSLCLLLVAANFCGGLVLTLAFTRLRDRIGALYACDLAGAAIGSAAALGLMWSVGPIRALIASGALAAAAAVVMSLAGPSSREPVAPPPAGEGVPPGPVGGPLRRALPAIVSLSALGACLLAGWIRDGIFDPNIRIRQASRIARSEWTHIARVDGTEPGRYIIDGDASTDIFQQPGEIWAGPEYLLVGAAPKVAIIGVGAGPELKVALAAGASSVLAVDINPTIVKWAREDRDINDGIFLNPSVTHVNDEGRHAVRSAPGQFDLIVMYAIDTWTASSQGAYGLTENFLYTTEAIQEYFGKLAPGGVMAVRRWLFWPPRETMRLFTTVHHALSALGVERPEDHILVIAPASDVRSADLRVWGYLFFSRDPFTAPRLASIDALVRELQWTYLWRPQSLLDSPFVDYVAAADKSAFYDGYPFVVTPSTDANPYFFQFTPPWSRAPHQVRKDNALYADSSTVLPLCLMVALMLSSLLLGAPLLLPGRSGLTESGGVIRSAGYFAAIGVGFMTFEISLIQVMTLFLGHPSYALGVVLAGLLAFAGTGSFLQGRVGSGGIPWLLALIAALGLGCAAALLGAAHALIHLPFAARLALALGALAGIGLPLGMPFAAGIRRLDPAQPRLVAWAWASNGAASVVGSCVAMLVLVHAGSTVAFTLAAVCYAAAILLVPGTPGGAPATGAPTPETQPD